MAEISQDPQSRSAVLLVSEENQQEIVVRCCNRSVAAGVKIGESINLSKAKLELNSPDLALRIIDFSPQRELNFLYKLAIELTRQVPVVSIAPEIVLAANAKKLPKLSPLYYGLVLELTGTERLYRGLERVRENILAIIESFGITVQSAVAPTVGAAWALARFRSGIWVTDIRYLRWSCEGLPIEGLRISDYAASALRDLGCETISGLSAIDRRAIGQRFGKETLLRIDQLFGLQREEIVPVKIKQQIKVARSYNYPATERAQVIDATFKLIANLSEKMRAQLVVATRYKFVFKGIASDGSRNIIQKDLALSGINSELLAVLSGQDQNSAGKSASIRSILQATLEDQKFNHPIDGIEIIASAIRPVKNRQYSIDGDAERIIDTEAAISALTREVVARLGPQYLSRFIWRESFLPENRYQVVSVLSVPTEVDGDQTKNTPIEGINARPSTILPKVEKIDVWAVLPDQVPARINWRGRSFKILNGIGPERIAAEWWSSKELSERDYFKVQSETGDWLWIYRENSAGQWFLQGNWS
jgi:protein ImuB